MPTKRSKSKRCIPVIDVSLVTRAEQLWARSVANWAQAQLATRCMQATARIPHHNTRLIN